MTRIPGLVHGYYVRQPFPRRAQHSWGSEIPGANLGAPSMPQRAANLPQTRAMAGVQQARPRAVCDCTRLTRKTGSLR